MKLALFEYVILQHPETDKDGNAVGQTKIIKDPVRLLAKDTRQVGMLAAREIPESLLDCLERVEIIVRPF